jgi:deoxyribodipyrimidine photo-lyase
MFPDLPPTREAALARLRDFVPHMGRAYAAGRNHLPVPGERPAVSMLSPYVRRRLLLEEELIAAADAAHGADARAFIDEVLWRSYWKGWLQHRPAIWAAYREAARFGHDRLATEGGLRRVFHDAVEGNTGIDCFDAWARELVAVKWLHNHARMWFASIWIFTLRLPWALGAEFFLRHLIDGDPASNTLSWRWVAGLHTSGNAYVARADNIARYTGGRFNPAGQLDERPEPLREAGEAPPPSLAPPDEVPPGPVALLLHDEDCLPETLGLRAIAGIGCVSTVPLLTPSGVAPRVADFARGALADAAARLGRPIAWLEPDNVAAWVARQDGPVVAAEPQVGPASEMLGSADVLRLRRTWDAAAWPHATRGFFQMRDRLPDILAQTRDTGSSKHGGPSSTRMQRDL